jgi:hypothetical protein
MNYLIKDAQAPATTILTEQHMKTVLVGFGYDETSISNNVLVESVGYVTVAESLVEQPTSTSILVADKENDGSWAMKWLERDLYDATKDRQVASNIQRKKRNELLAKTDWTQGKDISNTVSTAWTTYRQELRDVTLQPNFPYSIVWPTPPQ